jgi:CRISPR-associated protein Cas4
MLNEFVYCPRLFFYEWVEGVFAHSGDTVDGALRHETLGEKADALPPAEAVTGERIHSQSVSLSSDRLGLIAVIDLVEGAGARVSLVDYKHGVPREEGDRLEAWPTDRVQVCVQALILRDHGYTCDEAVVYYNRTKQRVRVPNHRRIGDRYARRCRGRARLGQLWPDSATARGQSEMSAVLARRHLPARRDSRVAAWRLHRRRGRLSPAHSVRRFRVRGGGHS